MGELIGYSVPAMVGAHCHVMSPLRIVCRKPMRWIAPAGWRTAAIASRWRRPAQ